MTDSATTEARGIPAWLFLLAALTAIAPLSIDMYLPSLPTIAAGLDSSAATVQLTLSAFLIGMALGQLAYGPLSDRFGRKPPIYLGLGIYVFASIGCAAAGSVEALIGWRFVQALGASAGVVISRAVIRDRTDARGSARALSLLMLVMGAAPILAPSIGGLALASIGWRGIFVLLAAIGALLMVGVHATMDESLPSGEGAPLNPLRIAAGYGRLFGQRAFILPALCTGLVFAGLFAYITAAPHVLITLYGVPAKHFGLIFGLNAVGLIAASQVNRRLLRRHSPEVLLARAIWALPVAGAAIAVPVFLGSDSLAGLLLGLFAFLTTLGFIMPNAAALALAGTGRQAGAASALMGALQFLLGTAGGLILSAWGNTDAVALAGVMLGFALTAFVLHRATIGRTGIAVAAPVPTGPDAWTGTDADLGASPVPEPGSEPESTVDDPTSSGEPCTDSGR